MVADRAFIRQVRDALRGLYDPTRLERHALTDMLRIEPGHGQSRGQALREALVDSIEDLRPDESMPFSDPSWLAYRIMRQRYVEARHPSQVAHDLGMSRTTFYRYHEEALQALALMLCDRRVRSTERDGPEGSEFVATGDAALNEAVRVARTSQLELVDMAAQMDRVLAMLSPFLEQERMKVAVAAPASLPAIQSSPMVLGQILLNVITEAVRLASADQLRLSVCCDDVVAVWSIGPLHIGDIRESVTRDSRALSLSEGLVQVYGGDLWIERVGHASAEIRFSIPLPLPVSVLIVEDNQDLGRLYARYLRADQYAVQTATSLDCVQTCVADSPPHLVLLDVLMPNNDGWQILEWLRAEPSTSTVPIVVCSVLDQPHLAFALGAQAVLQKPVTQADLLKTVHRLLSQDRFHRATR